ncbi:MAG: hypothetical protein L0H94_06960 [Nitrospira sp.]|nr:hypothetical protein [Nitrospira sp.]
MSLSLSSRQVWGMPIVLAVLSASGLITALLGDGIWDILSWIGLAAPVVAVGWYMTRIRR